MLWNNARRRLMHIQTGALWMNLNPTCNYFNGTGTARTVCESVSAQVLKCVRVTAMNGINSPPSQQMCTSGMLNDGDVESDASILSSSTLDSDEMDNQTDANSFLRIQLYPNDPDPAVTKIYNCTTVQEIFDLIDDLDSKGELTVKHCSQALISIWDLQKLLFIITPMFDPDHEHLHRESFLDAVRTHSTFNGRILKMIHDNYEKLEHEPLVASLLCMKKMNYPMNSEICTGIINECVKRKDVLSLPAISRLCVCLQKEYLYGLLICSQFLPLIKRVVETMKNDLEVRLVSIIMRRLTKLLSGEILKVYHNQLLKFLDNSELKLETVTLCKVLAALVDTRLLQPKGYHISETLMRRVGNLLVPRVDGMTIMEISSLERYLEIGPNEPYALMEALVSKISSFMQQYHPPRPELMASVAPFVKESRQKLQMESAVQNFVKNLSDDNFNMVASYLGKILRNIRSRKKQLHNDYWERIMTQVILPKRNVPQAVLRFCSDYLLFTSSLGHSYKCDFFEENMKPLLHTFFENYKKGVQPTYILSGDFARVAAFLLATSKPLDPIYQDMNFVQSLEEWCGQFRSTDLSILGRSVDISLHRSSGTKKTAKYHDIILHVSSLLEEEISFKLMKHDDVNSPLDIITMARLHLHLRKVTGESPIFDKAVDRVISRGVMDSRMARDFAHCLGMCSYYDSRSFSLLSTFIKENQEDIHPETVAKFLIWTYQIGYENDQELLDDCVFDICASIVERYKESFSSQLLVQSCLSLCFHRKLRPEVIHNIFCVDFLDRLDTELSSFYGSGAYPVKLRLALMALNRAVCLDMPDANVPWFHNKYCEEQVAGNSPKETYMHAEVYQTLQDVLGGSSAIQRNVFSPYYYLIDFLIEFDEQNVPIRKLPKKRSILFGLRDETSLQSVKQKVAIIVLLDSAFTKNLRKVKGSAKMLTRHLEILGYRVLHIHQHHWNSMHMTEPMARNNYLESLIFRDLSTSPKSLCKQSQS